MEVETVSHEELIDQAVVDHLWCCDNGFADGHPDLTRVVDAVAISEVDEDGGKRLVGVYVDLPGRGLVRATPGIH